MSKDQLLGFQIRRAIAAEDALIAMKKERDKLLKPQHAATVVPCYTPSGKRVALRTECQNLPIGTELYLHPSGEFAPADQASQEPPQREPMTDDEISELWFSADYTTGWGFVRFARAIEAHPGIGAKS